MSRNDDDDDDDDNGDDDLQKASQNRLKNGSVARSDTQARCTRLYGAT